jgi:hypothetical protein
LDFLRGEQENFRYQKARTGGTYWSNSLSETIYTKDLIGTSGKITSISYYVGSAGSHTPTDLKIYMALTEKDAFSNQSDWVDSNDLTLVYDGAVTIGATTGWETFTLSTPFEYDGGKNLVVAISRTAQSYTTSLKYTLTSSGTSYATIYRASDSDNTYADVATTITNNVSNNSAVQYRPDIKLAIETCAHASKSETGRVAATCTEPAHVTYYCSDCDKTFTVDDGVALGHDTTGVEPVIVPATCTTDVSKTYTCARCHEEIVEVIDALGHDFDENGVCSRGDAKRLETFSDFFYGIKDDFTVSDNGNSWTVTAVGGETALKQSVSGYGGSTYNITLTANKAGTLSFDWYSYAYSSSSANIAVKNGDTVQATLNGSYYPSWNTVSYHVDAGDVLTLACYAYSSYYYNALKGFTFTADCLHESYTTGDYVAATCEQGAYWNATCDNCHETITVDDTEHPALGHDYQFSSTVAPTCTTQGYDLYVCSRDAEHTEQRNTVAANGHTWDGDECNVCHAPKTWDGETKTEPAQQGDYYLIGTGEELAWFAHQVNSSTSNATLNAKLTSDINLGDHEWTPIGNYLSTSSASYNRVFSGVFDGDGHKITGLQVTGSSSNKVTGLFGIVTGGTIQNLAVYGTVAGYTSTGGYSGGYHTVTVTYSDATHDFNSLFGAISGATVEKVLVDGTVTGGSFTAAVAGYASNSVIQYCGSTAAVTGGNNHTYGQNEGPNDCYTGGIVGDLYDGSVQYSYNTGAITSMLLADIDLGGTLTVDGYIVTSSNIWIAIGDVNGTVFAGTFDGQGYTISNMVIVNSQSGYLGLFSALPEGAVVKNVAVTGGICCDQSSVGSIVGWNLGTVENCISYVEINVSNCEYVGGIVADNGGVVRNCVNNGTVNGGSYSSYVGGVVGHMEPAYQPLNTSKAASEPVLTGCVNTGNVTGYEYVGGIVGGAFNDSDDYYIPDIANCYNAGAVTGTYRDSYGADAYTGVIAGKTVTGIVNCYYKLDATQIPGMGDISGENYARPVSGDVAQTADFLNALGDFQYDESTGFTVSTSK